MRGIAATPGGLYVALAVLVAVLAFLPWGLWFGSPTAAEVRSYWSAVQRWVIWLAVGLPAATLLAVAAGDRLERTFQRVGTALGRMRPRVFDLGTMTVATLAAGSLSGILFAHNPHLVDTIAQLFQARIFTQGELAAPAPSQAEFFAASHLVQHEGRWFSQYPPGHPGLLAVGLALDLSWLVNPLFAAGTLGLVFAVGRRLLGDPGAKLAGLLLLVSPFALFMSASYMNHITAGFFLALALYAAVRADEVGASAAWAALAGLALGVAATIRPLEAAAWAAVLGLWLLWRRGWARALLSGAAALAGVAPLLAYNAALTGHPLRFGYTLLWGPGHGLGFHRGPWGDPFTPVISFANTALDFQRLNILLFEWPYPSLVFVIVGILAVGRSVRFHRFGPLLVGLLFAAPFAYLFYWHRDNYLGPRFVYASLVPAILLTVIGLDWLDRRMGRWRPGFRLFVAAGVLYALAVSLPDRAGTIAGLEPEMKLHPERALSEAGVGEALVFVKVGWGSRLIGRLWGWGVPAWEVEQTYRRVDGCRLQQALDRADSLAATGHDSLEVRNELRQRLTVWREMDLPVRQGLLPDPSVRVDPSRAFLESCLREVRRDQSGYTLYGTLIWRNDPWLRDGAVFARYLDRERNRRLGMEYRDRPHFIYAPESAERGAPMILRPLDLGLGSAARGERSRGPFGGGL